MTDIGGNIKALRKENGLSQDELGEKLGVSGKTVSSWEINRTEPNMGTIEKMCVIFNCPKSRIVGLGPSIDSQAERILAYYNALTKTQQKNIVDLMESMLDNK